MCQRKGRSGGDKWSVPKKGKGGEGKRTKWEKDSEVDQGEPIMGEEECTKVCYWGGKESGMYQGKEVTGNREGTVGWTKGAVGGGGVSVGCTKETR